MSVIDNHEPWVTTPEGRNHLRICATGKHLILTLSCKEVVDLCCDVDSLAEWYMTFKTTLMSIRDVVAECQGSNIPSDKINNILEKVGMYVQPIELKSS